MTLVERDAQLRRLEVALDRARQGRQATVLVAGEAGTGNTSLLQAFTAAAEATTRLPWVCWPPPGRRGGPAPSGSQGHRRA
jgi:Flp pilus assembly CpaF family ATPase